MATIKFKRGAKATMPTLAQGEPAYTTDEKKVYIGSGTSNIELARADEIPTKTSQLTNDSGFKTTDNNTTYTLTKSGSTITLTGSDGKTTSVTDADTNTVYTLERDPDNDVYLLLKDGNGNEISRIYALGEEGAGIFEAYLLAIVGDKVNGNTGMPLSMEEVATTIITPVDEKVDLHIGDKSNPHSVTKAQVGLGNVENKSSATIRGEITSANVTNALGYTPLDEADAYEHPTYTSKSSGLYKIAVDGTGHVSGTTAVTKADITALGIPAQDTTYTLPSAGSSLGGVKSGGDVTISSGVITVNDDSHNHTIANVDNLQSSLDAKVPTSRTVNGKALSANITLSASDVGAVPTSRTVNGKALSANITLSASDVGADASGAANTALTNAKSYTDTKIADLINSAPTTLDTLGEIATAMAENEDVVEALETAIGTKADASHTHAASAITGLATVATSGKYSDLSGKPTIPTKTSQLTNDSGYKTTDNNTTYSISKSGSTITLTGSDGSTTSVTDSDTNTTYSAAGTSLGLVKSGGDVTISSGVITVNDDSHNHTIANVDGLQTALDGKAASSHTHNYAGSSSAGGAATSANKLATARTISLTGDVTGSTSFDGSGNVSITATVADDSHNHTIANVDGLQSALDAKAASSHTHAPTAIALSGYTAGGLDPISMGLVGSAASNKTFGLPAGAIVVEYSTDGGSTWTSYTSDGRNLFNESRAESYYLGKATSKGTQTTNSMLRVTIEPTDRYCQLQAVYHWLSTQGNTIVFDLERSTIGAPNTFTKILSNQPLSGWSGNNIHYFSAGQFGGGTSQTSNYYKYRLTYKMTKINTSYAAAMIQDIRFYGMNAWTVPTATSGTAGNMVKYNTPYSVDANNKQVVFPEAVKATTFSGALSGNASTATKATKDASGNTITTTYATKTELNSVDIDCGTF